MTAENLKKSPSKDEEPKKQQKKLASVLFIHCETKLHIADDDAEAVDLHRVVRDPQSKLPLIPSKEIQRRLAHHFNLDERSETPSFSPASLLLFPVRTVRGVFAWCTSADRLNAYASALKDTTCEAKWSIPEDTKALVGPKNACVSRGQVFLEQYAYPVKVEPRVTGVGRWIAQNVFPQNAGHQWWQAKAARDIVVLPESELQTLIELSAMIEPEFGESDQLVEFLPPETIFFSVMDDSLLQKELELSHIMLGRGVSQGNGICRLRPLRYAKFKPPRKRPPRKGDPKKGDPQKGDLKKRGAKKNSPPNPVVEIKKKATKSEAGAKTPKNEAVDDKKVGDKEAGGSEVSHKEPSATVEKSSD